MYLEPRSARTVLLRSPLEALLWTAPVCRRAPGPEAILQGGRRPSDNLSLQGLTKLEGTNVLIKVDATAALEGQNKRETFERHIRDILGHKRPFKTDPGPNTTIALQC